MPTPQRGSEGQRGLPRGLEPQTSAGGGGGCTKSPLGTGGSGGAFPGGPTRLGPIFASCLCGHRWQLKGLRRPCLPRRREETGLSWVPTWGPLVLLASLYCWAPRSSTGSRGSIPVCACMCSPPQRTGLMQRENGSVERNTDRLLKSASAFLASQSNGVSLCKRSWDGDWDGGPGAGRDRSNWPHERHLWLALLTAEQR